MQDWVWTTLEVRQRRLLQEERMLKRD